VLIEAKDDGATTGAKLFLFCNVFNMTYNDTTVPYSIVTKLEGILGNIFVVCKILEVCYHYALFLPGQIPQHPTISVNTSAERSHRQELIWVQGSVVRVNLAPLNKKYSLYSN